MQDKSYVKLQDAYVSESNKIGDWVAVGYQAPGAKGTDAYTYTSTNFKYTGAKSANGVDLSTTSASLANGWVATSSVALNDCVAGATWVIAPTGTTTEMTYVKSGKGVSDAGCVALTPNFKNIGPGSVATTPGT